MGLAARSLAVGIGAFEAKLSAQIRLSPEDMQTLQDAYARVGEVRKHPIRTEVIGDEDGARLVTNGWVGVVRTLPDGRRQILGIALAGDVVKASPSESVVSLTSATSIDARPLLEHLEALGDRRLARAWRLAEADRQQRVLDHIVRLGCLTAYERAANLIAELMQRHESAGLMEGRRMPWPVTQEVLSDVLGLSIVHMNRVLQQLRRNQLLEIRAGYLTVSDPVRLAQIALAAAQSGGPACPS